MSREITLCFVLFHSLFFEVRDREVFLLVFPVLLDFHRLSLEKKSINTMVLVRFFNGKRSWLNSVNRFVG